MRYELYLPPVCLWHAQRVIIYAWIVYRWIANRWIVYCELAQPFKDNWACVMFRNRFKETIVLQEKWRVYFKSLIFYFCFLDVASLLKTCQHFSDGNFRSTRILLHDFFSTWSMFSLWKGSVTDGFIHNYLKLSNDKWDCLVSMLTFC